MQMYKTASELYVIYNQNSEGTTGLNMAFHDISEAFRRSDSNPYIEMGWKMADLHDDDLYHRFEGDKYMISDDINSFDWNLSIDPSCIDYPNTSDIAFACFQFHPNSNNDVLTFLSKVLSLRYENEDVFEIHYFYVSISEDEAGCYVYRAKNKDVFQYRFLLSDLYEKTPMKRSDVENINNLRFRVSNEAQAEAYINYSFDIHFTNETQSISQG